MASVLTDLDIATHYHVASMHTPPKWAADGVLVGRVGAHLFYARVR